MKNRIFFALGFASLLNCKNEAPEAQTPTIDISPNPCKDHFIVTIVPKKLEYSLYMRNTQGRTIFQTKVINGTYRADIDSLPEGLYLLSLYGIDTLHKRILVDRQN